MILKDLSIKNYRGITNCQIKFNSKMNIVVGNNGVGKTSILDACAFVLNKSIPYSQDSIKFRKETDMNKFATSGEIEINFNSEIYDDSDKHCEKNYFVKYFFSEDKSGRFVSNFSDERSRVKEELAELSRLLDKKKKNKKEIKDLAKLENMLKNNKEEITASQLLELIASKDYSLENKNLLAAQEQIEIEIKKCEKNLPLVAYYCTDRIVIEIPKRINKEHRFYQIDGYDNCLGGKTDFRLFFEWYRSQDDIINEVYRKTEKLHDTLIHVKRAIEEFTGFHNLLLKRKGGQKLILTKTMHGGLEVSLNMDLLSQGEKIYIALIGDIARRLTMLNPLLPNPLEGAGIIMIDEVELHLHPKWQREILKKLEDIFPNCQFIVTTHSPQIISSSDKASVFLLDDMYKSGDTVLKRVLNTYGKTSDQTLESSMYTQKRDPKVESDLKEVYNLLDDKNLDEAEKKIEILQGIIGDDIEITKLNALISRIKILG